MKFSTSKTCSSVPLGTIMASSLTDVGAAMIREMVRCVWKRRPAAKAIIAINDAPTNRRRRDGEALALGSCASAMRLSVQFPTRGSSIRTEAKTKMMTTMMMKDEEMRE